jgi:hypothetical protein
MRTLQPGESVTMSNGLRITVPLNAESAIYTRYYRMPEWTHLGEAYGGLMRSDELVIYQTDYDGIPLVAWSHYAGKPRSPKTWNTVLSGDSYTVMQSPERTFVAVAVNNTEEGSLNIARDSSIGNAVLAQCWKQLGITGDPVR